MITKLKVILEGDLAMFSREMSRASGHKESYLIKLAYSQWLKQMYEAGIEELKKNEAASVSEESGVLVIEEQPDAP